MSDDDIVYLDESITHDIAQSRGAKKVVTRKDLKSMQWKCHCGSTKYMDLGNMIHCMSCGDQYRIKAS